MAVPRPATQGALVLELPDPCVVLLVGPAGAGKTTFARRLFASEEILSSDAFRALVSGDEADQRATRRAFAMLNRTLVRRLADGLLSVVDATNLERHARRAIATRAAAARVPTVALVFDVPLRTALARNRLRPGRRVPDAVVAMHRGMLDRLLDGGSLDGEGHALVAVLDPVALDSAVVRRSPP
ncbi:MAG TPA: AAA family ATPase [Candidatus Limnocylindrales bacterium]|nr:AAA family ATPase [Candidatus Limnocylindrales bacterium]